MYTTQSKMISRAIWVEKKHVWKINLQKNGVRKSFYSSVPGDKGRKICAQNATSWLSGACPFSVSERTTVDTVFERYLQDKALETTNIYTIRNRYNNHIKPIIGKVPVMLLTKQDLKRVIYTAYRKHNLSQKSLKNIRGDLSGFCNYLDCADIRNDLRTSNIKIPSNAKKGQKQALDVSSLNILFTESQVPYNGTICQDSLIYAYRFQVVTGLRPGELMGLEWGDINAAGIPVSIDFSQLPHWLLAAATGMGKTQLALLILYQLSQKGYDIYLADYKGVDFGPEYRKTGHYADDDAALEQMLDSVVHELNHRRTEFSIAGCANLEEYVQTTGEELHRIVVILDETSMILDTTGRDKDGKAVVASITNKLLAIGRLGRALGIHLLVATQRPDVGSVPGSLKAQLDGRICGHTADAQSSIVILDDGSAAKLPAIPGRFIIRNGSGSDEIIQAYYYHQ